MSTIFNHKNFNLLKTGAFTIKDACDIDAAMFVWRINKNNCQYILYVKKTTIHVLGVIEAKFHTEHNLSEITLSAAENGFGPLLYEAVMSINGPNFIIPYRSPITLSAQNIWKKFHERESEIIRKEIPDALKIYKEETEGNHYRYQYTLMKPKDYSVLMTNHLNKLNESNNHTLFLNKIIDNAVELFVNKY
jgi:hypothetical protein